MAINNTNFSASVHEDNAGNLYLCVLDENGRMWVGIYANALGFEPAYQRAREDYEAVVFGDADPFVDEWETDFGEDEEVDATEILYHFPGCEPFVDPECAGHSGMAFIMGAMPSRFVIRWELCRGSVVVDYAENLLREGTARGMAHKVYLDNVDGLTRYMAKVYEDSAMQDLWAAVDLVEVFKVGGEWVPVDFYEESGLHQRTVVSWSEGLCCTECDL